MDFGIITAREKNESSSSWLMTESLKETVTRIFNKVLLGTVSSLL
jgi:hypothetical protein